MRAARSGERGSVLIVVAFAISLLLGFSAFAIDLGYARQRKVQAQNSADFAALAGAGVLRSGTPTAAEAEAREYVARNGFSATGADVHIPPTSGKRAGAAGCVQVRPSEQFGTIFGRLFSTETLGVSARATACASPGLGGPYAVFAGSTTCTPAVSFSGSGRTINGGVHSNNDMKIVSNGTVVNGDVTYLAGDAPAGNITFNPPVDNPKKLTAPLAYPEVFDVDNYAPGGSKALKALSQLKYHYAGAVEINETWLTLNLLLNPLTKTIAPGLYYTTGNIHLNGNGYNGQGVTFVSRSGDIHINGNNITFSPWDPDGLLVASYKNQPSCSAGQAVIKLDGNTHSWTGVMFAPNGPIDFSGTNIVSSLNGRLVGNVVQLSGSNQTITRSLAYEGRSDGFELVE
ncbi:MAG TPA: pilus assembly protein TadG-related protein [Actinomycetota bacterium]|nr:pilus assembly protein TadG-related protein [Actinomycetota bacterium]